MNKNGLTTAISGALIQGAGGGGKGGKQRAPIEAPDSLQSIAYAQVLDILSEGEIEGFADNDHPLRCIYLNETPIENEDGSLNFKNVQMDFRPGSQTQDYIKGFDGVQNEIGVGVELRDDTPWTRAITNLNLSSVRVRISVPALSKANTSNGDINGYSIALKIEIATDGGAFLNPLNDSFTGKTSTKYERGYQLLLPPATTGWVIRVTRLTANADSPTIADTMVIESFAEIIDGKLRMPMTALVATVIDAEQFNNIPTRAFHMKGRIIKVPSNYNPSTRAYTGVWDGTFQLAYSNNPAWVFYDMALNRRYGLGHLVTEDMVDKWALYQIAQYCDELVSDGRGGMEPRFTCNLYLQAQQDAARVMQTLATVFRGIMYASGSAITAVGDMPQDPIYTYTPANVIDGKFIYSGTARRVRHTVAMVSWNDMNDFGRIKYAYYQDDEGIARYGVNMTEVIGVGCTSEGQAYRMAKYIVTTERLETDSVGFSVGLDGTLSAPGKIINIADPLRAQVRRAGRVRDAGVDFIVVDAMPVGATAGNDLTVTMPDGTLVKRTVSAIAGNNVFITGDFGGVPERESVWLMESVEVNAQTYRVISVANSADNPLTYSIAAIQHVPGKFDFVEEGVLIDEPSISTGIQKIVAAVENIALSWRDVADAFTTTQIITLVWDAVAGASSYIVRWRYENGEWKELGTVLGTSIDWTVPAPGAFVVSVVAKNSGGYQSQPAYAGPFEVAPNSSAPGFLATLEDDIAAALLIAENAEAIADGKIDSFWQTSPPVIGSADGQAKEGDIWFDTDNGNRIYRVVGGVWTDAQDDALAQALFDAATAQATADGKVQTFFQSATPTASAVGDLWFNTTTSVLTRWNGSAWSQTLIDLGAISTDITAALTAANNAQATADGKIDSFWQTTAPVIGAGVGQAKEGDIWFDTDDGNRIYRVVGGVWTDAQDDDLAAAIAAASTAQATADGKVVTFFQSATPTALAVGDLWYNTGTKVVSRWNGSAWTSISDNDGAISKTQVFNPGWEQGLLGWQDAIGTGLTGWYTEPGGYTGSNRLVKLGGAANSGIVNFPGFLTVTPGQRVACSLVVDSQFTSGTMSFGLAFYDANGTYMGAFTEWNVGAFTNADAPLAWKKLRKIYTAPAGAVGARFCVAVQGHTGGAWKFDNAEVEYLPSTIDEVPDGNSYARMFGSYLQAGAPFQLSFGDNMVQNGRFEDTKFSVPTGALADGTDITPGWRTINRTGDFALGMETVATASSTRQVFIGQSGGFSSPNATSIEGTIGTKASYPVQPGEQYIVTCRTRWDAANSIPSGITCYLEIGALFYNAAGAYVSASRDQQTNNSQGTNTFDKVNPTEHPITVPDGVSQMVPFMRAGIYNGTGATYVTPFALIHARFDDFTCRKVHLASAGQPNLLRNTDFNNGLNGWSGGSSITISPTEGNQMRVGAVADGALAFLYQDTVLGYDLGSYVTYSASCVQIGTTLALGSRFHLYLEFYAGATYLGGASAPNVLPDTTPSLKFTRFSITGKIPPGNCDMVRAAILIEGPQTLFAMIQPKLEKGPFATAYVTGADGTYAQGLVHPGSRRRIGDQRNIPQSLATSYGAVRTATALSATSAGVVSVNAHTVRYGGTSVTYNAVASAVTGLTVGVTYIIYCYDEEFDGGTRTWLASTSAEAVMNLGDGVVIAGQVTIPSSGSSSGGGSGAPGAGDCVAADMLLPDGRVAGDIERGVMIPCWDDNAAEPGIHHLSVQSNEIVPRQPCRKITTSSGATVTASESTPMTLRDGRIILIGEMLGEDALVRHDDGRLVWERVLKVSRRIYKDVAKIKVHQRCYFAGSVAGATIATHNPIIKP